MPLLLNTASAVLVSTVSSMAMNIIARSLDGVLSYVPTDSDMGLVEGSSS